MKLLPTVMNVNWYLHCIKCRHYHFINVDWFKTTRDKFGKNKPLLWTRLLCSKCGSRNFSISRNDPTAVEGGSWWERELAEHKAFEQKISSWNVSPYFSEGDEKHDFDFDHGPDEPDDY